MTRRKTVFGLVSMLVALALYTTVAAGPGREKTGGSKVRIGTFDSRALAVAYALSDMAKRDRQKVEAEGEKAKAAGDEKRMRELMAGMKASQELLEKQGFGTWPVDNLLQRIKGDLPGIAKQADVDVIVCKWHIVHQRSGVEFTDVTDLMVAPFDPTKETQEKIQEFLKTDPVPWDYEWADED